MYVAMYHLLYVPKHKAHWGNQAKVSRAINASLGVVCIEQPDRRMRVGKRAFCAERALTHIIQS